MRVLLCFLLAVVTIRTTAVAQDVPGAPAKCGPGQATSSNGVAEEVYRLARLAWAAQRYPPAAQFEILIHVRRNQRDVIAHYHGEEDLDTGQIFVDRSSDEERLHPKTGAGAPLTYGVDVSFGRTAAGAERGHPVVRGAATPAKRPADLLGAPHLSAAYSFGLRSSVSAESESGESLSTLKTIGSIATVSRNYEIRCEPPERDDGGLIRLALRPMHEPTRFRLRELWIDPATYATVKIRSAGNFSEGPPTRVDWLTSYTQIQGAAYIESEVALGSLDYGGGKIFENVSIEFVHIQPERRTSLRMLLRQLRRDDDLQEP